MSERHGFRDEYQQEERDFENATWRPFPNIVPGFEPERAPSSGKSELEKGWNRAARANRRAGRPVKCPDCYAQLPVTGVCDCGWERR